LFRNRLSPGTFRYTLVLLSVLGSLDTFAKISKYKTKVNIRILVLSERRANENKKKTKNVRRDIIFGVSSKGSEGKGT